MNDAACCMTLYTTYSNPSDFIKVACQIDSRSILMKVAVRVSFYINVTHFLFN